MSPEPYGVPEASTRFGEALATFQCGSGHIPVEDAANLLTGYALIAELIATDMDESALAGVVDANYMAKLRGLRDLKDVTSNGKEAGTKAMQVNVLSEDAVKNLQKLGGI